MNKPSLTTRQVVPIDSLSPQELEKFICEVTPLIKQAEIVGSPTGSGDDGFDVTLKRSTDDKLICIQCKRYNSRVLNLSHIGPEIAKVGLKSALEGSDIAEHYFLTTGSVSSTINSALRESNYATFKQHALKALENKNLFKRIREDATEQGLNLKDTVENYLSQLEKIQVWSREGFDSELTQKWSLLTDIFERYFQVQIALREYPRPDFDRQAYLENKSTNQIEGTVGLIARPGYLPYNLSTETFENPLQHDERGSNSSDTDRSEMLGSDIVQILVVVKW